MESSKAEKMKRMLAKKKRCDKIAKEIVLRLIEPNVDREYLLDKGGQIHRDHWDDIIEERQITRICGWVLCNERLQAQPKQQYIIRKHKVLDITNRKKYCSSKCYGSSQHFRWQIPESPLWLRDEEPSPTFVLVLSTSEGAEGSAKVSLDGIEVPLGTLHLDDEPSSDSDSEAERDLVADLSRNVES